MYSVEVRVIDGYKHVSFVSKDLGIEKQITLYKKTELIEEDFINLLEEIAEFLNK